MIRFVIIVVVGIIIDYILFGLYFLQEYLLFYVISIFLDGYKSYLILLFYLLIVADAVISSFAYLILCSVLCKVSSGCSR